MSGRSFNRAPSSTSNHEQDRISPKSQVAVPPNQFPAVIAVQPPRGRSTKTGLPRCSNSAPCFFQFSSQISCTKFPVLCAREFGERIERWCGFFGAENIQAGPELRKFPVVSLFNRGIYRITRPKGKRQSITIGIKPNLGVGYPPASSGHGLADSSLRRLQRTDLI